MDDGVGTGEHLVEELGVEDRSLDQLDAVEAGQVGPAPVDRSSRATTVTRASASARHRLAPMNPAPPVTTTLMVRARPVGAG